MARGSRRPRLWGAWGCLWDPGAVQTGAVSAWLRLGPWLCGKLQKSLAECLRREGTGVRHGVVLLLSGPVSVKGRIRSKGAGTPAHRGQGLPRALPES